MPTRLAHIEAFLGGPTPDGWIETALERVPELLLDHANCEKKAASTALSLMFRYPERRLLVTRMSRLAREELRHFEQVQKLLETRGIVYRPLRPSRYAAGLREHCRHDEPGRLVDLLIVGALIEARSCERFGRLAPRLEAPIGDFYRRLLVSEARHYGQYLGLAERYDDEGCLERRSAALVAVEYELISRPDEEFQFHSGPPA